MKNKFHKYSFDFALGVIYPNNEDAQIEYPLPKVYSGQNIGTSIYVGGYPVKMGNESENNYSYYGMKGTIWQLS